MSNTFYLATHHKVLHDYSENSPNPSSRNSTGESLDSGVLDAYVGEFLPASLREESFHRGAQMLRKELYFDMFPR
jgi:hypothetical protein